MKVQVDLFKFYKFDIRKKKYSNQFEASTNTMLKLNIFKQKH